MRKVLFFICLLFAEVAHGQIATDFTARINFDTAYVQVTDWGIPAYMNTPYLWHNWIVIDTVNYHHNQWQAGTPHKIDFSSAYSAPKAILTDSLLPCIANDTSVFTLQFSNVSVGPTVISFAYRLNVALNDSIAIEYSADTGSTWEKVDSSFFIVNGNNIKPNWHQSTPSWDSVYFIAPYHMVMPYTFMLRFTFITDTTTTPRDGWIIDDLKIGTYGENVRSVANEIGLKLSPNPCSNSTHLQIEKSNGHAYNLCVTDVMGRKVYGSMLNDNIGTTDIDTHNWPKGIYYLAVSGSDNKKSVAKLEVW